MDLDQRLEQRIKALEYELKILKNEIQRTLLDIQEQVLTHYYPELRAGGSLPSDEIAQSFNAVQQKKQEIAQNQGAPATAAPAPETAAPGLDDDDVPDFSDLLPDDDDDDGDGLEPIRVQSINLDEARAQRSMMDDSILPDGMDNMQVATLSKWVDRSMKRMGGERVSKLVETVADKGWLLPDSADFVRKLLAMSDGSNAPDIVAVNEILDAVIDLSKILGRGGNVEEALSLIDEAKLG
jgi:hypothetical protein